MVLVLLGILAAFAIPRFANVNTEARQAAVRDLAGSLRSSSIQVHGLAVARGLTAASGQTIPFEGAVVKLVYGYPAASNEGIGNSLVNLDEFTVTEGPGTVTYVPENAPAAAATCSVTYTEAAAGVSAKVELKDHNCG
ncbi:MAG: pilus assembly FimT family protein [Panacagrimonas sp.]